MTLIPRTYGRKVRCGGAPLSRQFQGGRDRWLTAYLVSSRPVRDSLEGGGKTDYEYEPEKPPPCLFFGLQMHVHACAFSPPCIHLCICTYAQTHTKRALLLLTPFPGFMSFSVVSEIERASQMLNSRATTEPQPSSPMSCPILPVTFLVIAGWLC